MRQAAVVMLALSVVPATLGLAEDSVSFGRFGTVALYRNSEHPQQVVLFVSGDGGWNLGVVDMAKALASLDALVLGIDINNYLKQFATSADACSYPAADFEALSQYTQKRLGYATYVSPVLVGYSSGATLVYAILVQAPPGTFRGAISMGFCPDLPLTKPLCRGNGLEWGPGPRGKGYSFLPSGRLQSPWIAFQGDIDQVCEPAAVESYVKQVSDAKLVLVDKVGHGFSVQRNWMPQFRQAFTDLVAAEGGRRKPDSGELKDLPLVEVSSEPGKPHADVLAVILSGDGGWAGLDRELAGALADGGVSVVGLDSLRYFWTRRTPDGTARDLERVLQHYLALWRRERVILVGYSLGADALPFMTSRLPPELQRHLALIALLGPSDRVDFEFHLTDWLTARARQTDMPVLPEIQKLSGVEMLCVYGTHEEDSICKQLDPARVQLLPMEGAHHFGGNYQAIAQAILKQLGSI